MTRVRFLEAKNGQKKDTGENYYIVKLLIGTDATVFFPTAENYKKIKDKKPEYLKEYNAQFDQVVKFNKLVPDLIDLENIR